MAAASIALALGLVGCGEKQQEAKVTDTPVVTAPAEKPLELGISLTTVLFRSYMMSHKKR